MWNVDRANHYHNWICPGIRDDGASPYKNGACVIEIRVRLTSLELTDQEGQISFPDRPGLPAGLRNNFGTWVRDLAAPLMQARLGTFEGCAHRAGVRVPQPQQSSWWQAQCPCRRPCSRHHCVRTCEWRDDRGRGRQGLQRIGCSGSHANSCVWLVHHDLRARLRCGTRHALTRRYPAPRFERQLPDLLVARPLARGHRCRGHPADGRSELGHAPEHSGWQ